MISNSSKMNFILDDAKQNLNEELNAIIENKITSIRALINDTIKNNINDALQSFYKPDNKLNLDSILDTKIDLKLKTGLEDGSVKCTPYENTIDKRKYKTNNNRINVNENVLNISSKVREGPTSYNNVNIYIGKKFMIISTIYYNNPNKDLPIYEYYEHNLPLKVIFIIKTILPKQKKLIGYELKGGYESNFDLKDLIKNIKYLIDISLNDPLLFYSNAQNFEAICEEEYEEINKIKKELIEKETNLQSLINKENEKIEYYEYLDNQVNFIEEEQKKNIEEKQKLKMASEKIKQMKQDFEEEKRKFEEEKEAYYKKQYDVSVNNFDIDSYLKNEPNETFIDNESDINMVTKLDNK